MHTETRKANGQRVLLTPNCDNVIIDPNGRGSIEYAKARAAINLDFAQNFKMNQALAKRIRKESKKKIIEFLNGTVSKNDKGKLIVTFPDKSIAHL